MKVNERNGLVPVILAGLLAGIVAPSGMRAQSTPTQSGTSSSTSKTAKSKTGKTAAGTSAKTSGKRATTTGKPAVATKKPATTTASTTKPATSTATAKPAAMPATAGPAKPAATTPAAKPATPSKTSSVTPQTPPSPGMVWVNTNTKVYHKAGSQFYGKTKQGKWLSEADAQKAGYKAASN